jgi:elongation factor Ts
MAITISTELVKELRDQTGISVMQCRKALEEAGGDKEKALAILKKSSSDIAAKKAGREAKDGAVMIKEAADKAVLVALHCETDFVSRNEDFTNLLSAITDKALSSGAEKARQEASEMIPPVIQKTGENISLGEIVETKGNVLGSYSHNGKIGVIVTLDGGNKDIARDIAMHVAAMKPEYITSLDVDANAQKMMVEVFEKEVASLNKPEDIKKKMLEGKIATYFKEKTLIDQPFIKNPDDTVGRLLEKNSAKIKEVKKYFI